MRDYADLPRPLDRLRNRPFSAFARDALDRSVPQRFEAQARRHAGRLAVRDGVEEVSYLELDRRADATACRILERCPATTTPVGILAESAVWRIAAMLGVSKAGLVFLPLDAHYPVGRLQVMLREAGTDLLLTQPGLEQVAEDLAEHSANIMSIPTQADATNCGRPGVEVGPDAGCYLLFTSGTTGRPKGVLQSHRMVLHNILKYTNGFHIAADDRMSLVFSPCFGEALNDIFGALLNGASLHVREAKRHGVAGLGPWLQKSRVTILHAVPTLFRAVAAELDGPRACPCLRLVNLGGESVTRRDLHMCWSNVHHEAVVVNSYGSTETKLIAQYYADRLSAIDLETVPVGYEAPDTRVFLLDEHGKEVEPGVPGEIVVQSRYIARGYWRSSADRDTGFSAAGAGNGLHRYCTGDLGQRMAGDVLVHLGRKDDQVKLRGYRVNLQEIESGLQSHPDVGQAAVVVEDAERDNRRLVAVYTERAGRNLSQDGLRGMAEDRLPDFMVPSRFVVVDQIPVGENGKIDRTAVLRLLADQTAGETSRDLGAGSEFVDMIADVLGVDAIDRNDNFVDIGGDSLTAAQAVIRIEREYGVTVRADQVLESPTLGVFEDACMDMQGVS